MPGQLNMPSSSFATFCINTLVMETIRQQHHAGEKTSTSTRHCQHPRNTPQHGTARYKTAQQEHQTISIMSAPWGGFDTPKQNPDRGVANRSNGVEQPMAT
jgi:hypothetical protein